ncbi:BSD-domain protein, putative [Plasmodium malariae]|nr:BSD-domain protein, putative [Plasmodium malariae]SBT75068.1 BSD-domain protein, putative [Plasmodium malariae]SBT87536.1 BSD-domain protein, putative [Plasmodium malariae]
MGNKHSRRKKYELCEMQYEKEFELKFPWNEIIKWGSHDLNVDISIITIQNIIEYIKDITMDEETFFHMTEGNSLDAFHFDENFVLWAKSLLKEINNLKKVRYNVVPKLISENEFWLRYFSTIKMIIVKEAFKCTKN